MKKQNHQPLSSRVGNWSSLSNTDKSLSLDVPKIFQTASMNRIPASTWPVLPDKEPTPGTNGWCYRVAEPFISSASKSYVFDAINGGAISSGSFWIDRMSSLLRETFDVPVAQPCSSGFASIVLALQAIGINIDNSQDHQPEVILPSFTMIAVANAVAFVGAKAIFVDNQPNSYNPGIPDIMAVATPRTKAVIITHTYGVPADAVGIKQLCDSNGWILIEDISEAIGVQLETEKGLRYLGTIGHFGCASLYANKTINAGDGGFVLATVPTLAYALRSFANHGFTGGYHFLHFEKAMNLKMNGLGAAMAVGALEKMTEVLRNRSWQCKAYRDGLSGTPLKQMQQCGPNDTPWVFGVETISPTQRTNLRQHLADIGIETRNYFLPLHRQPAYVTESDVQSMKHCEQLGNTGFYLPLYNSLTKDDIGFICSSVRKLFDPTISMSLTDEPRRPDSSSVYFDEETHRMKTRAYGKDGKRVAIEQGYDPALQMMKLQTALDDYFVEEDWSTRQALVKDMKDVLATLSTDAEVARSIINHLNVYQSYMSAFESDEFETEAPWTHETLPDQAMTIPTTTELQTLQLVQWIIKTRPITMAIEVGCWLGGSTSLIADAMVTGDDSEGRCQLYAVDVFVWQHWMDAFSQGRIRKQGQSFFRHFSKNVEPWSDVIKPIQIPFLGNRNEIMQASLRSDVKFDFVYFDFTQDYDEMAEMWAILCPHFISNRTVIVINGLGLEVGLIKFVQDRASQLKSLYKPRALAKSFIYVHDGTNGSTLETADQKHHQQYCRFNFAAQPGWNHHHNNAFETAIEEAKKRFQDVNSGTIFIPAIEQYLCDNEDPIDQDWVGIVHGPPCDPEQFYVPDLDRLTHGCNYKESMSNCKGLFTLTSVQTQYLKENMPKNLHCPVSQLYYPCVDPDTHNNQALNNRTIGKCRKNEVVLVGSYMRDYQSFFSCILPSGFRKVLLTDNHGSETPKFPDLVVPEDLEVRTRLPAEEYEELLCQSIIFLAVTEDGIANTTLLECIARNSPIVLERNQSGEDYLGKEYPLFFTKADVSDLSALLTTESLKQAVLYLEKMDKSHLKLNFFLDSIARSAVALNCNPLHPTAEFGMGAASTILAVNFDVTILVCSYKRNYNLEMILTSLVNQKTELNLEIVVWNNNSNRSGQVRQVIQKLQKAARLGTVIRLIDSTANYYCGVRIAMAHLMCSSTLLICDDDIIPSDDFVEAFMKSHQQFPDDLLCLRGHVFLQHEMNPANPAEVFTEYRYAKFVPDEAEHQYVHFAHADACLVTRDMLLKASSIPLPHRSFVLVDDYWLSFVLNHFFGIKLHKVHMDRLPLQRSSCSDTPGLALYTRPEVFDARARMYVYHMMRGWPTFDSSEDGLLGSTHDAIVDHLSGTITNMAPFSVKVSPKMDFWKQWHCGFNVSSHISETDIEDLKALGVTLVRIGAVGTSAEDAVFDLCDLKPTNGIVRFLALERIVKLTRLLQQHGISLVLTLNIRIAHPEVWKSLADALASFDNVVGYDLINEPFTDELAKSKWEKALSRFPTASDIDKCYHTMIGAIREVDVHTPIVIEPDCFANRAALENLLTTFGHNPLSQNLIFSVHFYDPTLYVSRRSNKGRYEFPGNVPDYDGAYAPVIFWNKDRIRHEISNLKSMMRNHGLQSHQLYIGELGCARDLPNAAGYMNTVLEACHDCQITCCVYAFRETGWDAMNYELGTNPNNFTRATPNPVMDVIQQFVDKQYPKKREVAIA